MTLNALARLITNIIVSSLSSLVATANAIEASPAGKLASTNYYITFIEFAIIVGLMLAYYLRLRKRALTNKDKEFNFNTFTMILFIFLLFDFINDLGVLLGVLIH